MPLSSEFLAEPPRLTLKCTCVRRFRGWHWRYMKLWSCLAICNPYWIVSSKRKRTRCTSFTLDSWHLTQFQVCSRWPINACWINESSYCFAHLAADTEFERWNYLPKAALFIHEFLHLVMFIVYLLYARFCSRHWRYISKQSQQIPAFWVYFTNILLWKTSNMQQSWNSFRGNIRILTA